MANSHVALQGFQADEKYRQRIPVSHVYLTNENSRGIDNGFDAPEHRSRLPAHGVLDYSGFGWRR